MKRKLSVNILLTLIMFTVLTSCNKEKSDKDIIQLWYYSFEKEEDFSDKIAEEVKIYCEEENIPLKIFRYDKKVMSYQDYIFKRNLAAASGNFIIIDDARNLINISKDHADYTKLVNYDNLFSIHKGRFCVPIGINYWVVAINNDAMEYYGIDTSNKRVITYSEYLDIKQEMKEKGAKFILNTRERYEMIDYCLNLNSLLFVDKESIEIKNTEKFTKLLKKSILSICDNTILYYDGLLYTDKSNVYRNGEDIHVFDKKSKLTLSEGEMTPNIITRYLFSNIEDIFNKTLVLNPRLLLYSPCLYIDEKITNDKIYDVANFIISDLSYSMLIRDNLTPFTSQVPTFDTVNIREILQVNDDWEYIIKLDEKMEKESTSIINEIYKVIIKDELTSKELADNYYLNPYYYTGDDNYMIMIRDFVEDTIIDLARELSGGSLSLENFDPKNVEIIKIIDDKIKEFVEHFNIIYN